MQRFLDGDVEVGGDLGEDDQRGVLGELDHFFLFGLLILGECEVKGVIGDGCFGDVEGVWWDVKWWLV